MTPTPLVRISSLSKRFGDTVALDECQPGDPVE
jgi:hypothetical protein